MTGSRDRRLRQTLKVVAVNLILMGAGLLVLELIFGNWSGGNELARLHLIRDRTLSFDVSGLYPRTNGITTYRRDRHGLRGSYESPGKIDILTLGGSTTDQRYISEGETWQDVMAKSFHLSGRDVSVVNAGVEGQSTYGHLKNFEWWFPRIPDLKARYFLFYVGVNDFRVTDTHRFDDLMLPDNWRTAMREKSALYHLGATIKGIFEARTVGGLQQRAIDFSAQKWTSSPLASDYEKLMQTRLTAYEARLRLLAAKTKERGGVPIFVTQPARWYKRSAGGLVGVAELPAFFGAPINGVDYYHMMRLQNRKTLDVCRAVGGVAVDLEAEIDWDDDDFYDFVHNTPKGAEKIGRYLHVKLKALF